MGLFGKSKKEEGSYTDFSYLKDDAFYFDSACQTLRPQSVIDAMSSYFHEYNSCGGRVKYAWGRKVDEVGDETKRLILDFLGKSSSEYSVAFTLNTTTGLNIVLNQLPAKYEKVVTTEIEHNAVFLTTMSLAKRLNIPRIVLPRNIDGSLDTSLDDFGKVIFVANNVSNIDSRHLVNLKEISNKVHENGGIVIIDAAQGFTYGKEELKESDFDALSFSGHKIYGPSIGVIVIKNTLLASMDRVLLGGGMVEDATLDDFVPASGDAMSSLLELGLQDYAGIAGLNEALKWLKKHDDNILEYSEIIFTWLKSRDDIHVVNEKAGPVISFYSDKIDSHKLAIYLSEQGIMARSGYFCCYYFLKHVKGYPPLLRISLGKHNTKEQVLHLVKILEIILNNIK